MSTITSSVPPDAYQQGWGKLHEVGGDIIEDGAREVLVKTTPLPIFVVDMLISSARSVNVKYILPEMKRLEDEHMTPVIRELVERIEKALLDVPAISKLVKSLEDALNTPAVTSSGPPDAYQQVLGELHVVVGDKIEAGAKEVLSKTPLPIFVASLLVSSAKNANVKYILPEIKRLEDKQIRDLVENIEKALLNIPGISDLVGQVADALNIPAATSSAQTDHQQVWGTVHVVVGDKIEASAKEVLSKTPLSTDTVDSLVSSARGFNVKCVLPRIKYIENTLSKWIF